MLACVRKYTRAHACALTGSYELASVFSHDESTLIEGPFVRGLVGGGVRKEGLWWLEGRAY